VLSLISKAFAKDAFERYGLGVVIWSLVVRRRII
jgi:hypothetical protein